MKRFLIISFLAAIAFIGCDRTDDDVVVKKPVISIKVENSVPVTVTPGTEVDFVFSMKYKNGIRSAYATVNGKTIEGTECFYEDAPDSTAVEFSYVTDMTHVGNTLDFAIYAEGTDGAKGYYDYPVFVLAAQPDIDIIFPDDAPESFVVDETTPLSFDILVTSGSFDLTSITIYKKAELLSQIILAEGDDRHNVTVPFTYTPVLGDIGGSTSFNIEVKDAAGNMVTVGYKVKFIKEGASTELDEFTEVTMGFQKCTSDSQFINAVTGSKHVAKGVSEICADIDWCVFYSTASGKAGAAFAAPTFASLSSVFNDTIISGLGADTADRVVNWSTRNATLFKSVTMDAAAFASVTTSQEVEDIYKNATSTEVDNLYAQKPGSVIAFKINRTKDSTSGELVKYGLIRVLEPAPTNNTGFVTFDYKIQK